MRDRADAITGITDSVCVRLDDEYARLARELVARLARNHPSPLRRGDARIWAAGVVYALGQMNFLFDRSQTPHMTAAELAAAFGVVKTTMANKAGQINRLLDLGSFDPDFTRAAVLAQHPFAWLVEIDGFIVDARMLPPGLQDEARRLGLIPGAEPMAAR